jgi:fatty aldehyde-generating acyl-ACP reductase
LKNKVSITTNSANQPTYDGPLDFAFLGHPRDVPDVIRTYPHLDGLSASEITARVNDIPVHVLGPIHVSLGGRELRGELLSLPYIASDFRRNLRAVKESIFDALDYCAMREARIVGLGAFLPSVTDHGRSLIDRCAAGMGITTGHSYTAYAIAEHIRRIESLRGAPQAVAIVGAAGSTGRATINCLLSDGIYRRMIFVDVPSRLGRLTEMSFDTSTRCTSDFLFLLEADIIICVTNATNSILQSEHLASDCIVIDDAYPPNISLCVARSRPDIKVLKCLSQIPTLQCPFDFALFNPSLRFDKQDIVFTCLAETALLAASEHVGHFTIGDPTSEQVSHISMLASTFGVNIAPFHSFPELGEVRDSCIKNTSCDKKETPPCGGV